MSLQALSADPGTGGIGSASSAQRIMPWDSMPASLAGFKLVMTMTFLPTISSGV